jgi:hypothetical protein
MKQRRRIYYSAAQRSEIWDRWQAGEPMSSIGRRFDRESSSVFSVISPSTSRSIERVNDAVGAKRGYVLIGVGSGRRSAPQVLDRLRICGVNVWRRFTAVICVMLEATGPAAAFGAVAYWMIGHGA